MYVCTHRNVCNMYSIICTVCIICIYVYMCVHVRTMYIFVCTYMHVRMCMYIYMYSICMYKHVYMYVYCTWMHVHVCVCIHCIPESVMWTKRVCMVQLPTLHFFLSAGHKDMRRFTSTIQCNDELYICSTERCETNPSTN